MFHFIFVVCPLGSFYNVFNNDTCEICPADSYSNNLNSSVCTGCTFGTSTEGQIGQTTQQACSEYLLG